MTQAPPKHKRLGEILMDAEFINAADLKRGLEYSFYKLIPLGKVLVLLKLINEQELVDSLEIQQLLNIGSISEEEASSALRKSRLNNKPILNYLPKSAPNTTADKTTEGQTPIAGSTAAQANFVPGITEIGSPKKTEVPETPEVKILKDKLVDAESNKVQKDSLSQIAELNMALGDIYFAQNKCDQAMLHFAKSLSAIQQQFGCDTIESLLILRKLAAVNFVQKNWNQAETLYKRRLEIVKAQKESAPVDLISANEDLGDLYVEKNDLTEARKYFLLALKGLDNLTTPNVEQIKNILRPLRDIDASLMAAANVSGTNNTSSSATTTGGITSTSSTTSGGSSAPRIRLGDLVKELNIIDGKDLLSLIQEATDRSIPFGRLLVERKILTDTLLEHLLKGQVLATQGIMPLYAVSLVAKFAESQKISFEQAAKQLWWQDKIVGMGQTAKSQESTILMGKLLACLETLLSLEKSGDDKTIAGQCLKLAAFYEESGNTVQAELFYKRALGLLEKRHGKSHIELTPALEKLAVLYLETNRIVEAESAFWRLLENTQKSLGTDHFDSGAALHNLGCIKQLLGNELEAQQLKQWSLSNLHQNASCQKVTDTSTCKMLAAIADAYVKMDKSVKARQQYRIALKVSAQLDPSACAPIEAKLMGIPRMS